MRSNATELANFVDFDDAEPDEITKPDGFCIRTIELAFCILYSLIGITIFIGNSFTCVVFLTSKRLRKSFMNVFLVSLAFWDVLMAIFVVPFYAVFCSRGCAYSLTQYCWLFRKAKDCVLMATTFNICAITYDRYLAVVRPLHYGAKMTKRRVSVILAGVWMLPVVVAGIRNVWNHTKENDELRYANKLYDTFIIVVFVIFAIFGLLAVNVKVMRAIKRHNKRELNEQSRRTAWKTKMEKTKRRKGTRACILVVFVFMICWLPRIVYNLSYIIKPPGLASPLFFRLAFFCLFLQSSANPFIYSFYRSEFRRAALRLVRRRNRSASRVYPFAGSKQLSKSKETHDLAQSI